MEFECFPFVCGLHFFVFICGPLLDWWTWLMTGRIGLLELVGSFILFMVDHHILSQKYTS